MLKRTRPYIILGCCLLLAAAFYVWLQIPTYGGAIDAYAKEVMTNPEEHGLPGQPNANYTYTVYNLQQPETNCYLCVLLIDMAQDLEKMTPVEYPAALQTIRVEKNGLRWQAQPQDDFQQLIMRAILTPSMLPSQIYTATCGDFQIKVYQQTVGLSNNLIRDSFENRLKSRPKTEINVHFANQVIITYTGAPENKPQYEIIGVSFAPTNIGEDRPQLDRPNAYNGGSSSTSGNAWCSQLLSGLNGVNRVNRVNNDWDDEIIMDGGSFRTDNPFAAPAAYAADLYINGKLAAELTMLPVEN